MLPLAWMVGSLLAEPHRPSRPPNESGATPSRQVVATTLRSIVESGRHSPQRWPDLRDVTRDLRIVYDSVSWTLLWSRSGQPTPSARAVIAQLAVIDARGLDPVDYDVPRLRALSSDAGSKQLTALAAQVEFDVTLSSAVARVLRSLQYGRVPARVVHPPLRLSHEPYDVSVGLMAMTTAANPSTLLDAAEPPYWHYQLLKGALSRYQTLAADTGLQRSTRSLSSLRGSLQPDSTSIVVPALRALLSAFGDLPASPPVALAEFARYDTSLVGAMRRFQRRHGLEPDGVVGPATLRQLRTPVPTRVRQLELTLERWRWLPHDLGDPPPLVVNIPAFRLYAFVTGRDRESEMLSMDVIVGQAVNHKTPVFSATLQHLIFSPYWDVPPSIARKELLPKARRDAGYLTRNHYEILNLAERRLPNTSVSLDAVAAGRARIRQRPGEDNALGGVKFVFPNAFNVYMHDTPTRSAFTLVRRDLSHGCIRLSRPHDLARFLLRDQPAWDSTAISAAMHQGTPQTVRVTRPVPVHILYGTAAAREDGTVLFYEDIYGHDRTLAQLLSAGYPYPQ